MRIKRSLLAGAAVSALSVASIAGIASAAADATSSTSLVDKVAQHFNLNKDEVQKVFDEDKSSHQAEMETRYEQRLTQAVTDGKLTADQKSKILAKHKELKAQMEAKHTNKQGERQSMDRKTDAEREALMTARKAEMNKQRAEIEQWEKDNNIPSGYLFGGGGGMMIRHGGGGPGEPF
jgi:exonuclease VII large subunit